MTAQPKQVARYGPSWVSSRQPIDDLWTQLAHQNHNLALSVHLEKVPANAYRGGGTCAAGHTDFSHTTTQSGSVFHRVGSYFRSIRFDTADAERDSASCTPWHESPYADKPDLDKDADQASRRYRTKYLEQLPEFFLEEQYHALFRTILNVQNLPQYQWKEVYCKATRDDHIPQYIAHPGQLKYLVQQNHDGWNEFRSTFS